MQPIAESNEEERQLTLLQAKHGHSKTSVPGKSRHRMGGGAARLFIIAVILAFGPLAIGLFANFLNEYGLVSAKGTWELFRWAPIIALFTSPAAVVVLVAAVTAMCVHDRKERQDKLP